MYALSQQLGDISQPREVLRLKKNFSGIVGHAPHVASRPSLRAVDAIPIRVCVNVALNGRWLRNLPSEDWRKTRGKRTDCLYGRRRLRMFSAPASLRTAAASLKGA